MILRKCGDCGEEFNAGKHDPRKSFNIKHLQAELGEVHVKESDGSRCGSTSEVAQEAEPVVHQFFAGPEVEQLV